MIHISSTYHKDAAQNLYFYTEENWTAAQQKYSKNIGNFFSGKKNEVFIDAGEKSVNYLIGLGKNALQDFEIQAVANHFSNSQIKNIQKTPTNIYAESFNENQLSSLLNGLFLGTYQYPFKKDHAFWSDGFSLHIEGFDEDKLDHFSKKTLALCNGQFAAMEWLNKPANHKNAEIFSDYLKNLAKEKDFEIQIFNRQACEQLGLGAYLSVNQGSAKDAAFTVIKYNSGNENAKTVGLVGKSVLFDTGGISLKDPQNMHYMKSDLGGATAVLGSLIVASELKIPVNIVAIFPITDNAISRDAYLPSDVVTAYNGKTIEVLNTDAEGRMTLADGLSYMVKNFETDILLDLATLTGSAVRMFGDTCGALLSNNEDLKNQLIKSGDKTNQRLWNLPLWDIWKDDIQSDTADLKNISLKPIGDCIVAGKFLEEFIDGHPNWAHLDIAGVAFGNVNYAREKAATGYGVQLLVDFLENI